MNWCVKAHFAERIRMVAAGIITLHHWLTSDQSPITGSLTLAACFFKPVGYLKAFS
jgi:hypothetical protein